MKTQNLNTHYAEKPHVLVVDDDRRIRELLARYLQENDFVVMTAHDAAKAEDLLKFFEFDVLVVDVMMPGQDGVSFTRSLRSKSNLPVLLLTAKGEAQDRIDGLESGADDYLPKPFEPKELVLRLQAILRRTADKGENLAPVKIGPWIFDPATGDISGAQDIQNVLRLTGAEAALLKALSARANQIVSRDDLARRLGLNASERTIDVQVTRLRRKIEGNSKMPRYLQTVRGKGYMLRTDHD